MITSMEVLDAVQEKLRQAFPDRGCVEDITRMNFKRPSFYCRFRPPVVEDASRHSLHIKQALEVVCFEQLNGGSSLYCDTRLLLDTQQRVLQLFSGGFLAVKDRALHSTVQAEELDSDAATVVLQLDYYDERPEDGRAYPLMGEVQVAIEKEA